MAIDPNADKAMMDAVASQQLGQANVDAGAPPPGAVPPQAAPTAPPPQPETPPTPTEKVMEANAPNTEGDNQSMEAYIDVPFGEGDIRRMSQNQIAGMATRYKDLNHKNAMNKPLEPAIALVQQIMNQAKANGHEASGEDVAQFLHAAANAYVKNPQMGGNYDSTPDRPDGGASMGAEMDAEIAKWESENAVTLPPMYRQGYQLIQSLTAENAQMRTAMEQMLAQSQQITADATGMVDASSQKSDDAAKMMAANNLNAAQAKHQLPDDAEKDFFTFAFERGYAVEDFVDAGLVDKIMADFSANRMGPEMERLRTMASRREAFTGAPNASPTGGGNTTAPDANQAFMDAVTQQAKEKRGMV